MGLYRKKPVVIEAFRYDGDFINTHGEAYVPQWAVTALKRKELEFRDDEVHGPATLYVVTLEGDMLANVGDYIIKGIHGELYPCKPDIFEATYEAVE